jgi:hypothetical protein
VANTDTHGNTVEGVAGWTGEGDNDLHEFPSGKQEFHKIPFEILDPSANGRRACLGLSDASPYAREATVEVGRKASSLYVLHATGRNYYAGAIHVEYADGSAHVDHIGPGKISNWWYPTAPQDRKQTPRMRVAWRGSNNHSRNVGVTLYGLNNPHPGKTIRAIRFVSAGDDTRWLVLGLTLSDQPVYFEPDLISAGIPDNWGAAAVVYALVEGLCGVKDTGAAYSALSLSPRWSLTGEKEARVDILYPASGGYVSYEYKQSETLLELEFTGTMEQTQLRILLPEGREVQKTVHNGSPVAFRMETLKDSRYLVVEGISSVTNRLELTFQP